MDRDIIVISSDEGSPPTTPAKFCSKHQHLLSPHIGTTNRQGPGHTPVPTTSGGAGGGVIVISDSVSQSGSSDVEIIDVDLRIKVAVHTCSKNKARVQEVQHLPSCSHGSVSSQPTAQRTKSSPFKLAAEIAGIHAPKPIHTCTKHRGLAQSPGDIGSPAKLKATPVAAVLPRPRSGLNNASQEVQLPRQRDVPSSNHGNNVHHIEEVNISSSSQGPRDIHSSHTQQTLTQRPRFTQDARSAVGASTSRPRVSPSKRKLSKEVRDKRRSRSLQQQQQASSTDSDLEYESSPATRARRHRPRSRSKRRKREQKENLQGTNLSPPHGTASPIQEQRHRGRIGARQDRMYLDKVTEPLVQDHPLSNMPVKTDMITNLHLSNDIVAGDLPKDNARDPAKDGELRRDSSMYLKSEKIESGRKKRLESVHSTTISDSDSDNELADFNWNREAAQGDSRQDTSSPVEVDMYPGSRRALQENAFVRSHQRIASPHRSPLIQVTHDQVRVCSPRNDPYFNQRRTRERDSDGYNPSKRQKTGHAVRRLNLSNNKLNEASIKAHRPSKPQHDIETPLLVNSSDSEGLVAINWNSSPKKDVKREESKKRSDILKKNSDESRSAFSVLKRSNSSPDPSISTTDMLRKCSNSADLMNRLSCTEQRSRSQDERRPSSGNRSAFEFLETLSQSDSSDFESKHSSAKRVASTPSKLGQGTFKLGPRFSSGEDFITRDENHERKEFVKKNESLERKRDANKDLYLACIPVHVRAPEMCNKSDSRDDHRDPEDTNETPSILTFGNLIQTLLEGCQEEGHHNDAVDFIQSFTNTHRCPPNSCMKYILEDILEKVDSSALLVNSYNTLKHVQHLHPPSRYEFVLHWKLIGRVLKVLLADGASQKSCSVLKLRGCLLVLKHLTSLFAEDLELQNKNGCLNKSFAHNLLSADTCITNIRAVISWICECVKRIKEEEDRQQCDNVPRREEATTSQVISNRFLFSRTSQEKSPPPGDLSRTRLTILLMVLELLQKLLHMCLVVSPNLGQSASKIADEFLYYYSRLPSYYHKRKVLQTITCHPMRVKLIELILENCYEVEPDGIDQRELSLSISKIVEFYFRCIPPDDSDDDSEDDDSGEEEEKTKKDNTKDPSQDCEELVMLLLYLTQSYVWSSNGKLSETDRILRNRLPNESRHSASHSANQLMPYNDKFMMTMNDKEYLIMIGDFVDRLQKRLEAHCPTALTMRTKLYLHQLDAMRDLADCD